MKILFLLGAASRIRNFDRTIIELVDRGHTVRVAGRLRKGSFELPPALVHERVSARVNPTERADAWRDIVDLLRGARDYMRYFDPRFAAATRLKRRAYEIAPTDFVLFCERHPWMKRQWHLVSRLLAFCEDLVPPDAGFTAYLEDERPDLLLVTPLVTFESYQTDYLKSAHALGIPVGFIPFSWDNLTNKGLVRIQPDRVLVWNEVQRQEAIELHGCRPGDVVVTGAARFDEFFARTPSTARAEFLARYGLDPERPLLLYLGSSQLTGPNEMELIRRWAEALRSSADPALRGCNILVRPHPALSESWVSVDYGDLAPMAISSPASRGADQELFDSLHHAHAAVGLNTSAMLEAAIVGRPVHTLTVPGFDEGQVGTMHFRYLVEAFGGLALAAESLDEHVRQLAPVVAAPPLVSPRDRTFAEGFLRPQGIDRPVYPVLATEIERVGAIRKRPARSPAWHAPFRLALLSILRRRTTAARAAEDATAVGTTMSLRPVRIALEELQQSTVPVFVGPWVDSRANEIVYWIPFVRWATATYGIAPERLIVLSHGDVTAWYAGMGRRSLDFASLFSESELEHWARRTVPQSQQNAKQAVMYPFDREVVERAAKAFELADYQVLHPLSLFRVINRLRKNRELDQLAAVLSPRRLEPPRIPSPGLPKSFVAVSLAPTPSLPESDANNQFLDTVVRQLAGKHDVVILDAEVPAGCADLSRVRALETPRRGDIGEQTRVVARARTLVGGFGDATALAAFCGTPAVAYHSEKLPTDFAERLQHAAAHHGWAPVDVQRVGRFKGVRLPREMSA
jgi:hypothetical protein